MIRIIPAGPRGSCRRFGSLIRIGAIVVASLVLASCKMSIAGRENINVRLEADGRTMLLSVPAGSSVAQVLQKAGVTPGSLDRSEPPSYAVLGDGDTVRLVRVEERFRTQLRAIPFGRQMLRNESLREGEERLVQSGVNGQEELTYRTVLEDGIQTAEGVVKSVLISEPTDEIVMIGARSLMTAVEITGSLAYLSAGNAWMMEGSTVNRRIIVNSGDLDGHVFALSPDARYLLFTRRSEEPLEDEINTLWVAPTNPDDGAPRSLDIANIIHFADWYPEPAPALAYTTVEPRANAPGWQANNDLQRLNLGGTPVEILDARSGGVYGWWGTTFSFSSTARLAYARPDAIGLVVQEGGYLAPLVDIDPWQTHSDWAWTPGVAWGPEAMTLYYVNHWTTGGATTEDQTSHFDLQAMSLNTRSIVTLAKDVGMFAAPALSTPSNDGSPGGSQIAFLQAIFPEQSDVSRYRLAVMDRDGSNRRDLFPATDLPGLDPRRLVWAPAASSADSGRLICILYQGNLWMVDSQTGDANQVTQDGLVSGVDWK